MFSKILIANRGEIACRVIETARQMGVKTVAVYSDADANARHVKLADEAAHVGAAKVSESYLVQERLIEVALRTGAEAIHPGYGFLSENPDFVEKVEAAGLVFIGPKAHSIRAMGLKDAAKKLMSEAGVPVVPGYHGEEQGTDFLAQEADKIGYPVLIKARAGGGGKGMRKVDNSANFAEALLSCQREGEASFGDAHVLIEKYITKPRHIEVQVFGDSHGNVVHLFERDCSLQRRHQKVIEEAPAPGMSAEVRGAMTNAAIKAAEAIQYEGAGTIEFIADGEGGLKPDGFWFMEMNTRLQVEHPVTEAVTDLDLVEWQLRVASGESLPKRQDRIELSGHAFEARLYAEDVPKGFLPAIGTLEHLRFSNTARNDTGVEEGDTISPHYDPMIAKVICEGEDRSSALAKLRLALLETEVAGTVTNVAFLSALAAHDGFGAGEVDTGLIERDLDALTEEKPVSLSSLSVAALYVEGALQTPPHSLGAWQHWGNPKRNVTLLIEGEPWVFVVERTGEQDWTVSCCDDRLKISIVQSLQDKIAHLFVEGVRRVFTVADNGTEITIFANGETAQATRPDPFAGEGAGAAGGNTVLSPMPGAIVNIAAKAGDEVAEGDTLLTLEAMKMEHRLTAPRGGKIAEILCDVGMQVSDGELLVRFEEEG